MFINNNAHTKGTGMLSRGRNGVTVKSICENPLTASHKLSAVATGAVFPT